MARPPYSDYWELIIDPLSITDEKLKKIVEMHNRLWGQLRYLETQINYWEKDLIRLKEQQNDVLSQN